MTLEIFITCISLLICVLPIVIAHKTKSIFGTVHLISVVIFIQLLHLLGLLSSEAVVNKYGFDIYIASHIIWVIYSWLFCFGLVLGRKIFADRKLFDLAVATRDGWLIAAFLSWVGFKIYLISIYGVNAFSTYRSLGGAEGLNFKFAWWETAIGSYLASFAVGACVVYMVKAISIPGYWKKLQVSVSLLAFILPYLVALESNIGSRRFILLMVIIGNIVLLSRRKIGLGILRPKQLFRYSLLGLFVIGFSYYYQSVRSNYFDFEISSRLTSGNVAETIQGVGLVLIPKFDDDIASEKSEMLREGPFELTQEVVNALVNNETGILAGEITAAAVATVIPRVIAGEGKIVRKTDDILAERFSLWPSSDFLILDLPTSLPTIFFADLGLFGVLIAPLAMLFGFFVINGITQSKVLNVAPWHMLWMSILFEFSIGIEFDLTGLLANIRDALIVCPLALITWVMGRYMVVQKLRACTTWSNTWGTV